MKRVCAVLLGFCMVLFSGCSFPGGQARSAPFPLEAGQQDFSLGNFRITEQGIEG